MQITRFGECESGLISIFFLSVTFFRLWFFHAVARCLDKETVLKCRSWLLGCTYYLR